MQYCVLASMAALFVASSQAQFNLYPSIDPNRLATAFNISNGCLSALNSTVSCDQTLLTMAGTVDNYLWTTDNITTLCTQSCTSSTSNWFNSAQSACASDTLTIQGRQVPAWTIPGRTVDGLNIACLTPTTDVSTLSGVVPPSAPATSKRDSSGYCLIDSYGWTGSDIIRPDCSNPSNSQEPQCNDPTNVTDYNQRLSNLYSNDLLCSDCFIKNFYLRLASPYLPDTDYSDYLILQYYDMVEVCNYTTLPSLVVQYAPSWNDAPGFTDGRRDNATIVPFSGGPLLGSSANATGTCNGQSLTYGQLNSTAATFDYTTTFCDALSKAYNVSSGSLYQAFANYNCDISGANATTQTWCVPNGCTTYYAAENSTCDQIAAGASTAQNNITSQQIVQYNPFLQGFCDQLAQQYLCISLPGGAYIPPPVNSSSTNAGQQQRGGGDSSSTGNQTVTGTGSPAVTISAGGTAPSPTQSGIASDCIVYAAAMAGEGCYAFSQEHNVTADHLYAWNPVLGTAGAYCSNQFWNGYYYCIGTVSSQPTPTASPTPVSSGQPAPSPTQSGIVSTCDKYAQANSGDTCASFATNQGIGTAQLYTWNTQLGNQGQNCNSQFWAGYYYCVHAPDATSSQPSATPSPTQSGIVSNCNRYFQAQSGDTCYSFAQSNAITSSQLYTWNTQLGANGENCNTKFWAGYYYCTGVSASQRSIHTVNAGTSLNPRLRYYPLAKRDLPTGTCNANTPCANGACCGSDNLCGYSDKSCGSGCQHNCDAKAQCGPYAAAGKQKCPLNVCCSEFGFCGSTPEFCTWTNSADPKYSQCDTQYGGCGSVNRPSCGSGGNIAGQRSIGYYESWSNTRACQKVAPEDLNLDGFTSINFAFSFFDPSSFTITPMDSNGASLYNRFTALKSKKPGLKAFISVGGWSFTDPGATQRAFSNMVGSSGNRATFINALINFMDTYSFDGVDLDWEYPGADDRGGVDADTANYVALTKEMRAAFGSRYGLTVTIPTSYWYLQHFDLSGIQSSIDWFNLMAYDLHGTWDAQSKFVGPYIAPHTNLTEIDAALDLLWRAGVDSHKVVLGQGWYGRSFTLKDPSCNTPNGVCQFTSGANPGPCSQAAGILDYQEIKDIINQNQLTPTWDHTAGVKYITWNSNQWVSYDDADTFKQKRDLANNRCLGGTMVWALDQVDQSASNGFSSSVSPDQQSSANQMSLDGLSRLKCYVSDCNAACKAGTSAAAQFNGQPGQLSTNQRCPAKSYRSLCCDDKSHMGTCQWRGYRGAGLSCIKGCADGETELTANTNQHNTKGGDKSCHGGLQSYCCANYKPASSTLEDDLKDAAKSAAEAIAEQAALDVAAKAFCRIAVPALLAPLELIEDAIPIVGEILDAIEIAATPAIIEGCVKGIEKEGKAEFKVFGKTHSLKLDSPTTKPTTVPDRPAPKNDDPHSNGDKDGSCPRKAKRATTVERTATPRMQFLQAYGGRAKLESWSDGEGWALRFVNPNRNNPNYGKPQHYGLVAGYVRVTKKRDTRANRKYDCDGNPIQQMEYDWVSNGYDLVTDVGKQSGSAGINFPTIDFGGPTNVVQGSEGSADGTQYTDIPSDPNNGQDWASGYKPSFNRDWLQWTSMGSIRPGVTYAATTARCAAYCQAHPNYNILLNNCYTFANEIYAWMKDAGKALKRDEYRDETVLEFFSLNTTVTKSSKEWA